MSLKNWLGTQVAVGVPLLVVLYLLGVSVPSIVAAAVLGTVLTVVHYRNERAKNA